MHPISILALFCLVGLGLGQSCQPYMKFTPEHALCLDPNPKCEIINRGVTEEDKELILKLHNEYRSKVAMGKENGAIGGSLPKAADMMQMEWDDNLAAIAQKWTDNCVYKHNCEECRAVDDFAVGQNNFFKRYDFSTCEPNCIGPSEEADWKVAIQAFINEVKDYRNTWVDREDEYYPSGIPKIDHLTQLLWSKTWRVGCGYSYYKINGINEKFLSCNYGPRGCIISKPVYKKGKPCSACPTNTVCSKSSSGENSYPGLCKLEAPNTSPAYKIDQEGLLFFCSSLSSGTDSCKASGSGDGQWYTQPSVGGNFDTVRLDGGQSTTITFISPIVSSGNGFCLQLEGRYGPLDTENPDESSLEANMINPESGSSMWNVNLKNLPISTNFHYMMTNINIAKPAEISFTFSVKEGAATHVLAIRNIMALDGQCHV